MTRTEDELSVVCPISTFDTDYVLVKVKPLDLAVGTLRGQRHRVRNR